MTGKTGPMMRGVAAGAVAALLTFGAAAQDFKPFSLRVLGSFGNQLQSSAVEEPYFKQELPKVSEGKVDVNFKRMDEVGLKGFDAMRLLKLGVFDLMEIQIGYVSGDEPFFNGVDMLGVAPDIGTARKLVDAYREGFDKRLQEKFNGKLVAMWPYPGQMFFCNKPIESIESLKGLKIRAFTPAMASLVEGLGGISVTLAFPEVYQSLQRGVVDCAISGSMAGNTAKWPEVSTHFYPLALGWGLQAHVANLDFWNKLSPAQREFLGGEMKKLEDRLWELGDKSTQDGIECNTGTGPCDYGTAYKMKLVPVTQSDIDKMQAVVREKVLPEWIAECKRTYPECDKMWAETGGKVTGVMPKS